MYTPSRVLWSSGSRGIKLGVLIVLDTKVEFLNLIGPKVLKMV